MSNALGLDAAGAAVGAAVGAADADGRAIGRRPPTGGAGRRTIGAAGALDAAVAVAGASAVVASEGSAVGAGCSGVLVASGGGGGGVASEVSAGAGVVRDRIHKSPPASASIVTTHPRTATTSGAFDGARRGGRIWVAASVFMSPARAGGDGGGAGRSPNGGWGSGTLGGAARPVMRATRSIVGLD